MKPEPILYIFGGLPASGKTTLSTHLAKVLRAAYIRIDSIEEAIIAHGELAGPEGYYAAYTIAEDNIKNGLSVVADSVNSIELTRTDWIKVAQNCGIRYKEIHIVCSDKSEHQARLAKRSIENPSVRILKWSDIESREFEDWKSAYLFDTAGESPDESKERFEKEIQVWINST